MSLDEVKQLVNRAWVISAVLASVLVGVIASLWSFNTRLDRIEKKLDERIDRIEQFQSVTIEDGTTRLVEEELRRRWGPAIKSQLEDKDGGLHSGTDQPSGGGSDSDRETGTGGR